MCAIAKVLQYSDDLLSSCIYLHSAWWSKGCTVLRQGRPNPLDSSLVSDWIACQSTHPVRPLRSARLYPQTSISTGSPFQPPRGTFTPHDTHQETEKKLDIRCDKLSCGQWTNTWSNDTTNSSLAYRELCTVFSDC